jgi:hypothetical protein
MELREALSQIAEIRQQMARGQVFRGYRALTTAFSGTVALLTGILQFIFAPYDQDPRMFVCTWVSAAVLCLAVVAVEMVVRTRRSHSPLQRQLTLLAVEQFVPSVAAGGLLTWALCDFLPGHVQLLPGLWMILFALGVFASSRLLPRQIFAVAGYYMIAGIFTLVVTREAPRTMLDIAMAGVFSIGQFAIAAILYHQLERSHD